MSSEIEEELLHAFKVTKDKKEVERLLQKVPDPRLVRDKRNSNNTLLHIASDNGWLDTLQLLISTYSLSPGYEDDNGRTALHVACINGYDDIVRYLVEECSQDPRKKDKSGVDCFGYSKRYGRRDDAVAYYLQFQSAFLPTEDNKTVEAAEGNPHQPQIMNNSFPAPAGPPVPAPTGPPVPAPPGPPVPAPAGPPVPAPPGPPVPAPLGPPVPAPTGPPVPAPAGPPVPAPPGPPVPAPAGPLVPAPAIIPSSSLGNNDSESKEEQINEERPKIEKTSAAGECQHCIELKKELTQKIKQIEKEALRQKKKASQLKVSDLGSLLSFTARIQTQWKELGTALGIPNAMLEKISSNESRTELRNLYEMLQYWIEELGGSWGGLVGALRSPFVEQTQLADEVEKQLQDNSLEKNSLFVHTVAKDEIPLQESDVPCLMEAIFKTDDIDWKVLGLMLGLPHQTLSTIEQNSLQDCQKAMLVEWTQSGRAYWSLLVSIIGGEVIGEKEIANNIIDKEGLKLKPFVCLQDKGEDFYKVEEESIDAKNQHVMDALATNPDARGIVFFIGVSDSSGTDVDAVNVSEAFRGLTTNFVFFPQQNTTCTELSCLVNTVARGKCFSMKCKNVAFFYAGHGGIDEKGNSFLKLNDGNFFIERDLLQPFKRNAVHKSRRCLFFFDCCLSGKTKKRKNPDVPARCLVAHATSSGLKSLGNSSKGGVWTRHLCKNLKEPLSVSDILDHTYADVTKELKDTQQPVYISLAGAVFLNGVPKPAAKDASVSSDASSLWVFYSKEFIGLLEKSSTTLIALAGGFHCEGMISDEVNSTILDNSETKKGPQMFFDAVKQLLGAEPRSIHKVLDLMDVQEQLCGLVRRMKEDLGAQEDLLVKILQNHHEQIVQELHVDSTACVSLSGGLLSKGLITNKAHIEVSKQIHSSGIQKLLRSLEKEVGENPSSMRTVLDVMKKQKCLTDIVEDMMVEYKKICKEEEELLHREMPVSQLNSIQEDRKTVQLSFQTFRASVSFNLVSGKFLRIETTVT